MSDFLVLLIFALVLILNIISVVSIFKREALPLVIVTFLGSSYYLIKFYDIWELHFLNIYNF